MNIPDTNQLLPGRITPRHRQFQILARQQLRTHILQLQRRQLRQLARYPPEHMIIQIPCLIQIPPIARQLVVIAPFQRLRQIPTIRLTKRRLLQRLRPSLQHRMQRLQRLKHPAHITLAKVQPRRLLQSLVPLFVPQDRHPDQLLTAHQRLLHQCRRVVAHRFQYLVGGRFARHRRRFAGHRQRIHQRLRMRLANVHQQLMNQLADQRPVRIDARNQLRYHLQPRVDLDHLHAVVQRLEHVRILAIVEPQRQQAQRVLQRIAVQQIDGAEEAVHRRHGVFRNVLLLLLAARQFARPRCGCGGVVQLLLLVLHHLEVHEGPRVPRLVPGWIVLGGFFVARQNALDRRQSGDAFESGLPLAEAHVATRQQAARFVAGSGRCCGGIRCRIVVLQSGQQAA